MHAADPTTETTSDRSPSGSLRLLCVDDNPLVVDALHTKLALLGCFVLLDPLSNANELTAEVMRQTPDVVLLDLDMPGRDPLDALAELTAQGTGTKVLIFSGLARADLLDRAFDVGAWGFLSKHSSVESIVSAIRRVAAGEIVLAPEQ